MNAHPTQHPNTNPMFNFEGHDVRVVKLDTEDHLKRFLPTPWFVLPDYCRATNTYLKSDGQVNAAMARGILDSDEFKVISTKVIGGHAWGKAPSVTLVSESGLYKLILRANPNANPVVKRFQNWVTREVLPALRKDGMYVMGEEKVRTGEMSEDELILKAMTLLQKKAERLTYERNHAHAIIQEHLLMLPIQVWQGINECYLSKSEAGQLAYHASCMCREEGITITKEHRQIPNPKTGEKIDTWVNVYPKHILDKAASKLGFLVVARFDLVPKAD